MTKSVEKDITVIIPSRSYDQNLSFCIKNIRKYYKKIKIFLILEKFLFLEMKQLALKEI